MKHLFEVPVEPRPVQVYNLTEDATQTKVLTGYWLRVWEGEAPPYDCAVEIGPGLWVAYSPEYR